MPDHRHSLFIRTVLQHLHDIADGNHEYCQKDQRKNYDFADTVILLYEHPLVHIPFLYDTCILNLQRIIRSQQQGVCLYAFQTFPGLQHIYFISD